MKKYLPHFVCMFTLIFTAAGCKKDDDLQKKQESKLKQTAIAGVNGPTTGTVNQQLVFSILWQNADGATKFDHLKDSAANRTQMIRLFALTNVSDTTLVAAKGLNTVSYKFKADTPGVYYLKFYNADNSDKTAIIDTLTIK